MYYGYVQQSGMYETLDLVITNEKGEDEYNDYFKNSEQWYLAFTSDKIKEVIGELWFTYIDHGNTDTIKLHLEDNYTINSCTIKVMFAEQMF
jgi:transcription initiation factor IIE alpha subunit